MDFYSSFYMTQNSVQFFFHSYTRPCVILSNRFVSIFFSIPSLVARLIRRGLRRLGVYRSTV